MSKARTILKIIAAQTAGRFFSYLKFRGVMAFIDAFSALIRFDAKKDPTQRQFDEFLARIREMKRPRILELGSRNISHRHLFPAESDYVGFDINPGPGVDVVGDIHTLSEHFPGGHFDVVYAISVFEHLAMPWKAAQEINRVLKPGGIAFLFTHPVFPLHAEPWDFWRFSKWSFPVLFNARGGYEILDCQQGLPCVILPLTRSGSTKGISAQISYMGVALTAVKTGEADLSLSWGLKTSEASAASYPKEYSTHSEFFDYLRNAEKVARVVDSSEGSRPPA